MSKEDLINICKLRGIKGYCNKNKNNILILIDKYNSILKIQRLFRKYIIKDNKCPISLEPIKYPFYAIKSGKTLNYYNLSVLKTFLIESGDFRDPMSRLDITRSQLKEIDNVSKYYCKLKNIEDSDSVYKASLNKHYYIQLRERECELLTLERILDNVCQEIINSIEDTGSGGGSTFLIDMFYVPDYRTQLERLKNISAYHANYSIDKNINNFNYLVNRTRQSKKKSLLEYIIHNFYQIKLDLDIL